MVVWIHLTVLINISILRIEIKKGSYYANTDIFTSLPFQCSPEWQSALCSPCVSMHEPALHSCGWDACSCPVMAYTGSQLHGDALTGHKHTETEGNQKNWGGKSMQ